MSRFDESQHPRGEAGKFATKPKGESAVTLVDGRRRSDSDVLDRITRHLGTTENGWSTGEDLDAVVEILLESGRPHPGDAADYQTPIAEWKARNPRPQDAEEAKAWVALNKIARHLGTTESWRSEELEIVADICHSTGRPHPGHERTLREYEQAEAASRRARGLEPDAPAGTRATAQAAGLPVVHDVLELVWARETVSDAQFATVSVADVERWHEELIGPAADRMADQIQSAYDPDAPILGGENDAWEHVRDCAQDAGVSSAAEVIWLRHESGDLNAADLESLTDELVADMHERHLRPVVEEIEAELRSR